MRKLKVDMSELEFAFEQSPGEMSFFLDTETGELILITDEIRYELERIYEDIYDERDEEDIAFAEALRRRNMPEWMHAALRQADQVEQGYGSRYIDVPSADSREGYQHMEDFIDTVQDADLQDRLWNAIRGRGAFRRFKDVLLNYPQENKRWFDFKQAQIRQRVLEWLETEGIEPLMD